MGVQILQSLLTNGCMEDLLNLFNEVWGLRVLFGQKVCLGPMVRTERQAASCAGETFQWVLDSLGGSLSPVPAPRIEVRSSIEQLHRRIPLLYLLVLAPVAPAIPWAVRYLRASDPSSWAVAMSLGVLLGTPILISRRIRINLEHSCGYTADGFGRGIIHMEQMPRVQFSSFLAHEYAHHVFSHIHPSESEPWFREGWARAVQWASMARASMERKDPSFLFHVWQQVAAELKFALKWMSRATGRRLPRGIRKARTLDDYTPFVRFLTGTPTIDPLAMEWHSAGTAAFFLAARHTRWGGPLLGEKGEGKAVEWIYQATEMLQPCRVLQVLYPNHP